MQPQPLIAVDDVERSSRWYQQLLNCTSGHGGNEYERLMADDRLILQLHRWDVHEHPFLGDQKQQPYGNGVLLWFQTEDFDQAKMLDAEILEGPHINENAQHWECWLRDLDGYVVVLAGKSQ